MDTPPAARPSRSQSIVHLFDELAPSYDQAGVDFFRPVATHLVALLEPAPGERAADIGCGRGAATFPLATAVGPGGEVFASDLAPAMVAATAALATTLGLHQVRTELMDASRPDLPVHTFDLVASSLVLFFLPDPAGAAHAWTSLLRRGGRLGVSTFGTPDGAWAEIDALFKPHLPPAMLDARAAGLGGPFASNEGMDALLTSAGLDRVVSTTERAELLFDDSDHWHSWSMSTGQRALWAAVPDGERPSLLTRAHAILHGTRRPDGRLMLSHDMRYTIGHRPS